MSEATANLETGAAAENTETDAASRFAALLDKGANAAEPATPKQPREAQQQAAPIADAAEGATDNAAADPMYKVKVDGEEIEVTLDELQRGYQRDKDYRNKTEALAQERRQTAEQAQLAAQQRSEAEVVLKHYLATPLTVQPPNPALIDSDPVTYLKQQRAFEQQIIERQNANAQLQQIQQLQAQTHQQQIAHLMQDEGSKLLEAVPEWKDSAVAEQEKGQLQSYLSNQGYSKQQIDEVLDHRIVVMTRKAMLYDQLVKDGQQAVNRVKPLPKVERPGNGAPAADGRSAQMQALKKSGSIDDAAAVFANRFK